MASYYLVFGLAELFLGELKGARRKRRDLRAEVTVLARLAVSSLGSGPGADTGTASASKRGAGTDERFLPKLLKSIVTVAIGERADGREYLEMMCLCVADVGGGGGGGG